MVYATIRLSPVVARLLLLPKRSRDETLEEINKLLGNKLRRKRGREESSSVDIIDSQSIKTSKVGGECRGVDGGQKIKGRKRHIVTDTPGLLIGIDIHAIITIVVLHFPFWSNSHGVLGEWAKFMLTEVVVENLLEG